MEPSPFYKRNILMRERRTYSFRSARQRRRMGAVRGTVRCLSTCETFDLAEIAAYYKKKNFVVSEMVDVVAVDVVGARVLSATQFSDSVDLRAVTFTDMVLDDPEPANEPSDKGSDKSVVGSDDFYSETTTTSGEKSRAASESQKSEEAQEGPSDDRTFHVFFFSYGVIVWWSYLSQGEDLEGGGELLLREIELNRAAFEEGSKDDLTAETFQWAVSDDVSRFDCQIDCDIFSLPSPSTSLMVACSHGLAQSAKLRDFESRVEQIVDRTKHFPSMLLSEELPEMEDLGRMRGELFLLSLSINLHTDILDTPEHFWNRTEVEGIYLRTRRYMEITTRVDVLNKRLGVVNELFDVLGNEVQTHVGNQLEWYIIWLLLFDVILSVVMSALDYIRQRV